MPKVKISDFSTTAGNNTDINSINIAEGCAPSGINDAIRTLMAQLKDWQSGAVAQDNSFNGAVTVSGAAVMSSTLAVTGAQTNSSNLTLNGQSGLRFADSDSSNWVAFQAPATVASNVTWTLPAADGTANQVLKTDGAGVLGWVSSASGDVTTTGTQTLTNKTLTDPTVTNYTETRFTANSSTAITLNLSNGTMQDITLTGSPTITMPTATAGKSFILILRTGSGSYSVTWSTVKWPGGTAPTVTSTASRMDIYSFFSDGTNWYGTTVGQNYTP